jgi:hypothetical protein
VPDEVVVTAFALGELKAGKLTREDARSEKATKLLSDVFFKVFPFAVSESCLRLSHP